VNIICVSCSLLVGTVFLLQCCLSVCLSVTLMSPVTMTEQIIAVVAPWPVSENHEDHYDL